MSHASYWREEAEKADRRADELRAALRNAMFWVNLYHDAPAEAMKVQATALLGPCNGGGPENA